MSGTSIAKVRSSLRGREHSSGTSEKQAVVRFGQLGWLAKGIVYVFAGVLVLYVAGRSFRSPLVPATSSEASPTGAIVEVSAMAGGRALLAVLAGGLVLYCIWRLLTALLPGDHGAEALAMRAGYLISVLIYGTFALTALSLVRHPHQAVDGDRKVRDITSGVMHAPLGRFLIGTAGLVAIGAGLFRLMKAARRDVADELDLAGLSATRQRWTRRLAVAGEAGRGVAVALLGLFFLRAAVTTNASEATGLDGALKRLSMIGWGRFVVAGVGVGFLLYGVLCLETFTRRKLPLHESLGDAPVSPRPNRG